MAKLISPYGGRVSVADERVEQLLAMGYRSADAKASAPAPAKDSDDSEEKKPATPARRKTTNTDK